MIINGYLRKKIVNTDGEIIGYNQDKIPLCLITNSNAQYLSSIISDGLRNKQFNQVYTLRTSLSDSNASRIEIGDQIENLVTKEKRIVKQIDIASKRYGMHSLIYFVGVE